MKYITYDQTGGRTGHILKDIMTCYVLSCFIDDLVVLPHHSWNRQKIFDFDTNDSISHMKKVEIDVEHDYWDGMPHSFFVDILNTIDQASSDTVVVLKSVTRVLPVQLTTWYEEGLIDQDVFVSKFLPVLRSLYFAHNKHMTIDQLAIHVRRGDIAVSRKRSLRERVWSARYFDDQISSFRNMHPDVPIVIYTERGCSEDLNCLMKHENTRISRGSVRVLRRDFNNMVNSKFFMPCDSSLSIWASYISNNNILISADKDICHFHAKHIW